jgi:hypothetical protein
MGISFPFFFSFSLFFPFPFLPIDKPLSKLQAFVDFFEGIGTDCA